MIRKLCPLLAALLASALLAAGCGGDDNDGGGDPAPTPKAQKTSTPANGGTTVDDAVKSCKDAVGAVPQLSDDTKKELEDTCEKASDGDEKSLRKAAREICTKVAEETVPTEVGRDQVVDACESTIK